MRRFHLRCSILLLLWLGSLLRPAPASGAQSPSPTPGSVWTYTLIEGSDLVDDCPACARPTILMPLRGTFTLRRIQENPISTSYAVENISFSASGAGQNYKFSGQGSFQIGGEVALLQEMTLNGTLETGSATNPVFFASGRVRVTRRWPMLDLVLDQTNGTALHLYQIQLAAAPFREIWFSTAIGLHSASWSPPTNGITSGDLLSSSGRVVRRNHELTRRLGVMPAIPDLGLDAVDLLPGGEIGFSLERAIFSETLGPLQEGDLVSDRGRILERNQDLLAAFVLMPPVSDLGLDAAQTFVDAATGRKETWFSIRTDGFSEQLGRKIGRGDVLSSRGEVVRSNAQLLARFQPVDPKTDYGLDALYVWPGGEIWFSTEDGFSGAGGNSYLPGDLLSDQGYVVFRNLELLNPFAPLEDVNSFGLDALWVVTDVSAPAAAPRITSILLNPARTAVTLHWLGEGSVFQVQASSEVAGPYLAIGPISPDLEFTDVRATGTQARRFYRVIQR